MDYSETTVLVTGGLGFIGSNLAHDLVAAGADVRLLDARLPNYGSNPANIEGIRSDVEVIEADVRDAAALRDPVRNSNIVFHLAAQLSRTVSNEEPATDAAINCEGLLNVLAAAEATAESPRVVFTSSQAVVGSPAELPFDETTAAAPLDVYGANKRAGELYCDIYHRVRDVPTISARLTNVYGPRAQLSNPNYGVINNFIASALRDERMTVFDPGTMTRDFVYVDDVVDGLARLGRADEARGERYVIGSGRATSILDLARMIEALAGMGDIELVPWPDEWDAIRVGDLRSDPSKLVEEFDWTPKTDLEEGLTETLSYYRGRRSDYL